MSRSSAVRGSAWIVVVALTACGDDAQGPDGLDGSSAPSCPTGSLTCGDSDAGVPAVDTGPVSIDAGSLDATASIASDAGDAGRDAAPRDADVGPCVSKPTERVYDLCVWTSESDLARIYADPEANIEVPASVSLNGLRYENVEFELHGGSGRLWPKKSYRVRFRDKPRPEHDFFGDGVDKAERLVLQGAWIDPTFVRNKIIFDTLSELGALAPRLGYARVYINGRLNGLYQVIERVDEHYLERKGFSRTGNLYKAEWAAADFRLRDDPLSGFAESNNQDGIAPDLGDLFRAVFDTPQTYAEYQREIATRIALNDFDLFNIVMSHVLNLDTFIKNYYLFHDPAATDPALGSVFRIIHWDADASLGIGWNTPRAPEPERAALWSEIDGELQDNDLARRLYAIPEYRSAYLDRFEQLLAGPLSAAALWAKAEPLMRALESDIRRDLALWGRDRTLDEERAFLKQMIDTRARVMAAAIAAKRAAP